MISKPFPARRRPSRPWAILPAAAMLVTALLLGHHAMAQSDPFGAAQTKLQSGANSLVPVIAMLGLLGGFGLVVLAYFGRFNWRWAFSLGGGLFALSIIALAISWLSNRAVTLGF